jgi:hypothetical protein
MMSDELASAASANANAGLPAPSPYSLSSRAAGAVGLHSGWSCRWTDWKPAQGFDASSASFATVFILRAVPVLAAGILSLERPMPLP